MSAGDLVRYATDVLFLLVFVAAVARAVRERRRTAVDAALFFGALAWILLQSELTRALGVTLPRAVSIAAAAFLLSMPYLLLRLVEQLVGVPKLVMRGALAGFVVSVVIMAVAPQPMPLPATLLIVAYFGGLMIYAAVLLIRGGAGTSGVARQRTRAAAVGSILLGAGILAAGAQSFVPFIDSVTRILVLGSALAYFASFATPSILKRAWQEPELRAFLAHVSEISPRADLPTIVAHLESGASRATGANALVALEGAPMPANGNMAVIAEPMIARGRSYGQLAVHFRREPLFPEDDRSLVALLADQAAMVIDGARVYQDLAEANRALAQATQAKSEFLANMSHELRTPMNAILGFSDLLMEQLDERLTPAQQRYFRNIKDAGGHLLDLINEVLDLSKVEAGRLELRPEPVRLGTLVEPVIESTRRAAQAKSISFTSEVADGVVVRVDPGRVRQILYNLLSNAVKFTGDGGHVELRARVEGEELLLEVEDSGIGIPADRRDRVFGTFERLHEGRSEVGGTGLGLALTKKLIELHGGEITFESEEGRGTTFLVRVADALFSPVLGERLLVVDDTSRDAELVAAVATQHGIATELVATVTSARDAVRRDPPIGIVLDLRLPDERGDAFLEELKRDPSTASIPVLVVSVEDDEGRSRPLGADDHLTKPMDRDRLATWIKKVAARRPHQQLAATR